MLVNQICNQALKQTVWMHVYITHKRIILIQGDSNSGVYGTVRYTEFAKWKLSYAFIC